MNDTLEDLGTSSVNSQHQFRYVTVKYTKLVNNSCFSLERPRAYADSCNKVIDVLCVLADINAAIISTQQSILDTNYGRDAHALS